MTTAGSNWSIFITGPGNLPLIGYQMFSVSALHVLLWLGGGGGDTVPVSVFTSWEQFRCLPPSIRAPCYKLGTFVASHCQRHKIKEANCQVTTTYPAQTPQTDLRRRRRRGGRIRPPEWRPDLHTSPHSAPWPAQADDPGNQKYPPGLHQGRPSERQFRSPAQD